MRNVSVPWEVMPELFKCSVREMRWRLIIEQNRTLEYLRQLYQLSQFFTENLLATEMKKAEILMNNPVYLGLSILESSNILLYEFWYDDVKPKYGEKARLCYMYTASFVGYTKTDTIYKDITEDIERFDII